MSETDDEGLTLGTTQLTPDDRSWWARYIMDTERSDINALRIAVYHAPLEVLRKGGRSDSAVRLGCAMYVLTAKSVSNAFLDIVSM